MSDADKSKLAVTESPEFKKALADAVAAVLPAAVASAVAAVQTELVASAAKQPKGAAAATLGEDFASRLALAIAEISDQGTSRKRVAPEILAARAKAHERAVKRLSQARDEGEQPEYRLVSKVYLNEQFIEPYMPGPNKQPLPTEIIWLGMPNDAMRPLNQSAREIYELFRASVGSAEPIKGADNRSVSMTRNGLVIKGLGAAQRREVAAPMPFEDGLGVKNQNDPTAPFVHVLGTIAPPARQNVAGTNTAVI
jgi:hypothetical protein